MEPDYVKLKQIKPAISGYIRESQSILKKSPVPDEEKVHDIRVLMKKSRALLKLTALQQDIPYLQKNIDDLKEIGRILSSQRDTSVFRKILKDLRKKYPAIFSGLSENENIKLLLEKPEQINPVSEEMNVALSKIEILLNKAGYRIRFQSMKQTDPQLLLKELGYTYIMVMDIYLKCRNNPTPGNLHKFRKKSKDFLYQLNIFRPLNPRVIKAVEKKLETMTLNLGKYNDLAQIIKALGYKYNEGTNLPVMDELIVKIREKQDTYLMKVWPSAFEIFCPGQKLVNVLGFKLLII